MFNEINTGRYNRLLQRLLQIKADPPAPSLAGEVMPVLSLESELLEWEYLKGTRVPSVVVVSGADAANPSRARLRNPLNSGVLAVITSELIYVGAAAVVSVRPVVVDASLANAASGYGRDVRTGVTTTSACLASEANSASGVAARWRRYDLAAGGSFFRQNDKGLYVLGPGNAIDIETSGNNIGLTVNLEWRERALESSEA